MAAVSFAQQNVTSQSAAAGPRNPARNPNQVAGKQSFGTKDLTYVRYTGLEFYPYNSQLSHYVSSGNLRWSDFSGTGLEVPIHVPTGAIIDYVELDACDSNATTDMSMSMLDCDPLGNTGCSNPTSLTTTGSTGCQVLSVSSLGYTVDNANHAISIEVVDNAGDGSLLLSSVAVGYRLQVSPAPVTPTFADVDGGSIYYQFIEALSASGITAGCDGVPNFCPDRPITRQEMAVFMAKALGLHFPN
jgi:hypothetical protein